jgi:hypothetical protein
MNTNVRQPRLSGLTRDANRLTKAAKKGNILKYKIINWMLKMGVKPPLDPSSPNKQCLNTPPHNWKLEVGIL